MSNYQLIAFTHNRHLLSQLLGIFARGKHHKCKNYKIQDNNGILIALIYIRNQVTETEIQMQTATYA